MNKWMDRLFRRVQAVKVITEKGKFSCRGIVQEIGHGTDLEIPEPTRYGELSVPMYRYIGNAKELLDCEDAVMSIGEETFTVLGAKEIFGVDGCAYIEAVLERQVADDDGE